MIKVHRQNFCCKQLWSPHYKSIATIVPRNILLVCFIPLVFQTKCRRNVSWIWLFDLHRAFVRHSLACLVSQISAKMNPRGLCIPLYNHLKSDLEMKSKTEGHIFFILPFSLLLLFCIYLFIIYYIIIIFYCFSKFHHFFICTIIARRHYNYSRQMRIYK